MDQLRLVFEGEYARWRETRNHRHLLGGKELRKVLHSRNQFVQGENAATKTEYIAACMRRRAILRLAASAAVVAAAVSGYGLARAWDSSIQQQKLMSWGLPPELFKTQHALDDLDIRIHEINDFTWLHSTRLRELQVRFDGSSFKGLEHLKGLTSLSLDLFNSKITSFKELEPFKGLSSLTLRLSGYQTHDLKELEQLKGLTSLSLNLTIQDLKELEQLQGLTSLSLDLGDAQARALEELEQLQGLTSLSLDLRHSQTKALKELEQLKGLTSLTLHLYDSQIKDLKELEQLKRLTSLELAIPVSLASDVARLKIPHEITKLWIVFTGSELTEIPAGYKFVGLRASL